MEHETFDQFSGYIQESLGIKMGRNKKVMLQSRLMKRLRFLGLTSYEDYYTYLFSDEGMQCELPFFVNQVTTNKTDFFREPSHYDYLVEHALPDLLKQYSFNTHRPLRLWSSACSTGEEPYTLSMVLSEFKESHKPFDFSILGTDISTSVLMHGVEGVYNEDRIQPVPLPFRKKYLLRSKDHQKRLVRIARELRAKVTFQQLNLIAQSYDIKERQDIIFCRNVMIYFDRVTQEAVLLNLCNNLSLKGYIFMGHSESLSGFRLPIEQVATSIYRKK